MGVTALAVLAAGSITTIAAPVSFDDLAEDIANRARLGMEARVLYDDNILRLDEGQPAGPNRSKDDVRTTLSAVVDVAQRVSRQRLFVRGAAGYDFYANNRFLRRERIDGTTGVQWQLASRCDGEASFRYGRGQTELSDLEMPVRNRRESRTLVLDGGCTLGVGLHPEVGYRRRSIDNSAGWRLRNDLDADRLSVGVSYNRTGRTTLVLALAEEMLEFPNRRLSDGRRDATRVRSLTARVTRRGAGLIASGVLGYADADSRNPAARDYSGLVGGVSVAWISGPKLRLTAWARREVDATGDLAAGYFVADRGEVVAYHRMGRAVELELGGLLERRWLNAVDPTGPDPRSYDRTGEARAAVAWQPIERLRLAIEVAHARRTTDASYGSYGSYRSTRGLLVLGLVF